MNNGTQKSMVGLIAGTILGFFGFFGIMVGDFIAGLALLIPGLILIPQIGKLIEDKWNIKFTKANKIIIVVVGLFIFGSSIDSQDSDQSTQEIVQEAVSEVEKVEEPKVENINVISEETQDEVGVSAPQNELQELLYPILSVVDGDTVAVEIDGKKEVLRLIGMNTPETVDPRKPVECFGKEASARAKEILTNQKVRLEADPVQGELDKYNRILRYVILEDGTNFNKKMIEDGYAFEYTYNTPYKYQAEFKEAEKNAREGKKGLWAEDSCNGELTEVKSETAAAPIKPVTTNIEKNTSASGGTCAGKRTCGQMSNCAEAYFYLNSCGVGSLDRDKDGIPCETICN